MSDGRRRARILESKNPGSRWFGSTFVDNIEALATLLEKALEKVGALSPDEQDAIASQILASLADEASWKKRFIEKRDVIRRMAHEPVEEDEKGQTVPLGDLL